MEILAQLLDYILHFEVHLDFVIQNYPQWTHIILFLIIFCETGLVVLPFLPGDSLLFVIGAFAARGSLDPFFVGGLLVLAAVLGDGVNYHIGKFIGPKIFDQEKGKWLNKEHLKKAHAFYERYGGKTIIFARFVPIVRTFAPFVAGIGTMTYSRFMAFNLIGAVLWMGSLIPLGYVFGNLPIIQRNFKLVVVAIIVISTIPAVVEVLREKIRLRKSV